MGYAQVFLIGLFAVGLAAVWYDDHVDRVRSSVHVDSAGMNASR